MTTTKQLIEYLKTLPDDTEVRVIVGRDVGYNGHVSDELDLDLSENGNFELLDFKTVQDLKEGHSLYKKTYLTLGEA